MSIASEITLLTNDRNDIRTALVNKGVSAASSHGFDDFAADINNIPTGSTPFTILNVHGSTLFMTGAANTHDFIVSKQTYIGYLLLPCNFMTGGSSYIYNGTNMNGNSYGGYGWGIPSSNIGTVGTVRGSGSASIIPYFTNGSGNDATKYTMVRSRSVTLTLSYVGRSGSGEKWRLTKTQDPYYGDYAVDTCVPVMVCLVSSDGELAFDLVNLGSIQGCFAADTVITLSDGTTKLARDIEYSDLLKSVDFDNGWTYQTTPLWIKTIQTAPRYQLVKFASGRTLKLVGPDDGNCHRMYCMDTGSFEYAPRIIGKRVYCDDGKCDILESWEWVEEPIEYMNIVGNYHMSIFTNGILTSCRQNNIYPIEGCRFIKDDRPLRTKDQYDPQITQEMFDGLRLAEQTAPIEEINEYVINMLRGMK